VLAYATSFLFIANSWVGHDMQFHLVRRFGGGLTWLALAQLSCVAFLPFPTSVVGEHVSDPVAQQFYLGSFLVTSLAMWATWWYLSSGHRLVDPELSPRVIRRLHLISSGVPALFVVLMVLVAVGAGLSSTHCCWRTWWPSAGWCWGWLRDGSLRWPRPRNRRRPTTPGPRRTKDEAKGPAKRANSRTPEKASSTRSSE
jgi:hypothetical protein